MHIQEPPLLNQHAASLLFRFPFISSHLMEIHAAAAVFSIIKGDPSKYVNSTFVALGTDIFKCSLAVEKVIIHFIFLYVHAPPFYK